MIPIWSTTVFYSFTIKTKTNCHKKNKIKKEKTRLNYLTLFVKVSSKFKILAALRSGWYWFHSILRYILKYVMYGYVIVRFYCTSPCWGRQDICSQLAARAAMTTPTTHSQKNVRVRSRIWAVKKWSSISSALRSAALSRQSSQCLETKLLASHVSHCSSISWECWRALSLTISHRSFLAYSPESVSTSSRIGIRHHVARPTTTTTTTTSSRIGDIDTNIDKYTYIILPH